MQIYLVGGAVRDAWLARESGRPTPHGADRDWVVVGATPEAMVAAGFEPVGRDFPVFLHPQTHEEYALARTERKTAPGYHGFAFHAAPGVTLEEDLARRDLTVNAMAVAAEHADHPVDAPLIDPWDGLADLRARTLRHVTPAFAEDPVRILRVARFAARWGDFSVAPDTQALMRAMVERGETDHLVAERVWQEIARGLMEAHPGRLIAVLDDCGLLARWGLQALADSALTPALENHALFANATLPVRWSWLVSALNDEAALRALADRWRVPNDARDLALLVQRERRALPEATSPPAVLDLFGRCDAWRKPARFRELLLALNGEALADADGGAALHATTARLARQLARLDTLDAAAITRAALAEGLSGPDVGKRLLSARLALLQADPER
ncbi:MAG: multifunctional CCA tRNA nucleotidyl transferase/2'3'-cyclic phosphodiesterase/2'nucleotidase/phosphatase [Hydrogenophaga sp.]|nr:multifunctional CCA tRNA nucleotidyl transferase/2'3'-cyclic phosphodiesterase/2'nucleotidase/phosphatase [Hydrogenophaga sp.]